MRIFFFITVIVCLLSGCGNSSQQSSDETSDRSVIAQGEAKFLTLCVSCHGTYAQGIQTMNAPALAGNDAWYLDRQLNCFRNGARGVDPDHSPGLQMAAIAKTITSDAEVKALGAYLASLPERREEPTLQGDAVVGKQVYHMICSSCHGTNAKGIEALYAPNLTVLNDWYVVDQLRQFKYGSRGTHKGDAYGPQMREITSMIEDEKTMADLAGYITLLSEQE